MTAGKPVVMVVTANIENAVSYRAYMEALVGSGLFARFDATPLATGGVRETLEGSYAAGDITALIEFPSSEAAHRFWDSPEYRAIALLRKDAGNFRVGLWRRLGPS